MASVYPALWRRARAEHPDDWRAFYRCLARLADAFLRDADRDLIASIPASEQGLLCLLCACDVEATLLQEAAGAPFGDDPLGWLDPAHHAVAAEAPAGPLLKAVSH
jgi:hypothetical protein